MQVITFSRQIGSLGDVIAAIVAREKGFRLIGPAQVHERAETCDPEFKDICVMYETEKGPGFWERFFFDTPVYLALFEALTYEFASEGKVVLIGRGSQLVLRDVPGVFSVRTVAPTDVRVQRVAERLGLQKAQAAEFVRKHDRERRALIQSVFEHDVQDWTLYDLIINTEHYTAEGAAAVVCQGIDSLERAPEPEHWKERLSAMALAKRVEAVIKKRLTPVSASKVEAASGLNGEITLSGRVSDPKHKEKAEKIASEYPGVKSVVNKIVVTQFPYGY